MTAKRRAQKDMWILSALFTGVLHGPCFWREDSQILVVLQQSSGAIAMLAWLLTTNVSICLKYLQVYSSNLIQVSSSCVISRVADSEQQTYSRKLLYTFRKGRWTKKPFAKRFVHLAVKKVSILYSTYTLYSAGQAGALWRQLCIRNNACCVAGTLYNP